MVHTLVLILIIVLIVGLFIYLLDLLPIDKTVKMIGKVIMLLVALLYLLERFGGSIGL